MHVVIFLYTSDARYADLDDGLTIYDTRLRFTAILLRVTIFRRQVDFKHYDTSLRCNNILALQPSAR